MENDKILAVLASMLRVNWSAHDLHYRAHGEAFYALHLLADKVDFGTAEDDLKEAYYLGQSESMPPTDEEIIDKAVLPVRRVGNTNAELVTNLMNACKDCMYFIEEAKRIPGLMAGVHAILDGVSQNLLTVSGLCARTLKNEENGVQNAD